MFCLIFFSSRLERGPQPDPARLCVSNDPIRLSDERKREYHVSDVNHEMDVGLHGWVSTSVQPAIVQRYTVHERALYFKSPFFFFFF